MHGGRQGTDPLLHSTRSGRHARFAAVASQPAARRAGVIEAVMDPVRQRRAALSWERQSIHGESYRRAVWSGYILIWRTEAAIHSMARWILARKDKVPLTKGPLNRDPLARW